MKILFTIGPIPAKLDSVKLITNKFKGGLSLLVVSKLHKYFDIEVVKWEGLSVNLPSNVKITNVSDVLNYRDVVLSTTADAYVLSAAVANLMPINPWATKFPSHNYKSGDRFNITFTLTPRVIDLIKKLNNVVH